MLLISSDGQEDEESEYSLPGGEDERDEMRLAERSGEESEREGSSSQENNDRSADILPANG